MGRSATHLVLLDLDGCLVDSTAAITGSIRHALSEVGVRAPAANDLRWCIGPPLLESLRTLLLAADADPDLAPRCLDGFRAHYRTASLELTAVIPGIPEALGALAARARMAVVTSKPGEAAEPLIDHLGLSSWFEAVFAPRSDHGVEPKTVTLSRALASLAPEDDPARAVMIGDRSHDVLAGVACGTRTVGVSWGAGDRAELHAAGADHVVDAPADLPGAVFGP